MSPVARRIAEAVMPTRYGDFRGAGFQNGDSEAVALTREPLADDAPMVKLHSECVTGATLGSLRYDCGEQLDAALAIIAASVVSCSACRKRGQRRRQQDQGLRASRRRHRDVDANLALGFPSTRGSTAPPQQPSFAR